MIIYSVSLSADVDECSADSSPCDENADCTNSEGSYNCTCKQGFDGDGVSCEGKGINQCHLEASVLSLDKIPVHKKNDVFFIPFSLDRNQT